MATAKKTTAKKTTAKKTTAKKTTAKKTTAKKTTAKKTTAAKRIASASGSQVGDPAEGLVAPAELKPSIVGRSTGEKRGTVARYTIQGRQTAARVNEARTMSLDEVAVHALTGRMGTGRERDNALRQAGHDPVKVTKLMAKLNKEAQSEVKRLPVPNNRRGSSWT